MTKTIETRERVYRDEDGEITGRSVDEYIGELLTADGALLREKVMEQVGGAFIEADRAAAFRASEREPGQTEG